MSESEVLLEQAEKRLRVAVADLHDSAERVYRKYGIDSDWTEWTDLRDALLKMEEINAG